MQPIRVSVATAALLAAFAVPARADCQCLAQGKVFHHGDIACLSQPGGSEALMQCGMVLNNSSWQKLQDGCPVAAANAVPDLMHAPQGLHAHRQEHGHSRPSSAAVEIAY